MPIIKGLKTIPLSINFCLALHGSPPHSSIPSVIKMMMFFALASGKSLADCVIECSIGVIPVGCASATFDLMS